MPRLSRAEAALPVLPGQIVCSRAGHDRDKVYLVIAVETDLLWLCDGSSRPFEKPKKKKRCHVGLLSKKADQALLQRLASLGDHGQRNSAIRSHLARTSTLMPGTISQDPETGPREAREVI